MTSALIFAAMARLVRRYGARLAVLAAGYWAGWRSAHASGERRILKDVQRAAKSDGRVRDALRRGDDGKLRDKWRRRD